MRPPEIRGSGAAPAPGLHGKVALVTGALGLLGREHCRALASAGAHVVATDLDALRLRELGRELGELSGHAGEALAVAADVTEPSSLDRLRAAVLERHDRLDVLVNNAAIDDKFSVDGGGRFEDYPLEQLRRVLDVNVGGVFACCQRLGGLMAERGGGSIINIASTYAVVAPNQDLYVGPDGRQRFYKSAAYPASKGAVLQLTRFLAAYWGQRGVRVNALSPGGVEAGQDAHFRQRYAERTPLGRMARASDCAGALLFLASDASAYMTGANLIVDGGFSVW